MFSSYIKCVEKKKKMRTLRAQKQMGGGLPFIPLVMLLARVGMIAVRAFRVARVGIRAAQTIRRVASAATRIRKVANGAKSAAKSIKHVAKQSAKRHVKKQIKKQVEKKAKDRLKDELENQIEERLFGDEQTLMEKVGEKNKRSNTKNSKVSRQVKKNKTVKLPVQQQRMIQMRMKQFANSLLPVDSTNSHRYRRNYRTWTEGNTIQNRVKRS